MRKDLLKLIHLDWEISRNSLFKNFFDSKTALVTFHPVTNGSTKKEFLNVINALEKTKNLNVLFSGPNNDPDNQIILSKINCKSQK